MNPQKHVLKVVGLIAVIFIAGYFILGKHNSGNTGRVVDVASNTKAITESASDATPMYASDGKVALVSSASKQVSLQDIIKKQQQMSFNFNVDEKDPDLADGDRSGVCSPGPCFSLLNPGVLTAPHSYTYGGTVQQTVQSKILHVAIVAGPTDLLIPQFGFVEESNVVGYSFMWGQMLGGIVQTVTTSTPNTFIPTTINWSGGNTTSGWKVPAGQTAHIKVVTIIPVDWLGNASWHSHLNGIIDFNNSSSTCNPSCTYYSPSSALYGGPRTITNSAHVWLAYGGILHAPYATFTNGSAVTLPGYNLGTAGYMMMYGGGYPTFNIPVTLNATGTNLTFTLPTVTPGFYWGQYAITAGATPSIYSFPYTAPFYFQVQ